MAGEGGENQENLRSKKREERTSRRLRGCKRYSQMLQRGEMRTKECPFGLATWRPLGTPERVSLVGMETW